MKRTIALALLCSSVSLVCATTDAPSSETSTVVASVRAPFVLPDDLSGQKLLVNPSSNGIETTLISALNELRDALVRLLSNPAAEVASPTLTSLTETANDVLSAYSDGQTVVHMANTEAPSGESIRILAEQALANHAQINQNAQTHAALIKTMATALLAVIERDSKRQEKSKNIANDSVPADMFNQVLSDRSKVDANIAKHKKMLQDASTLIRALYRAEEAKAEPGFVVGFLSTLSRWAAPSAQNSGVTITLPGAEERAYLEFVRGMLGTPSWVLEQATREGVFTWVNEPAPAAAAVVEQPAAPIVNDETTAGGIDQSAVPNTAGDTAPLDPATVPDVQSKAVVGSTLATDSKKSRRLVASNKPL